MMMMMSDDSLWTLTLPLYHKMRHIVCLSRTQLSCDVIDDIDDFNDHDDDDFNDDDDDDDFKMQPWLKLLSTYLNSAEMLIN